jgi:hypothetical protein
VPASATASSCKVYTAGLYLQGKAATPEAVLAMAGPKRMHVVMLRDIDATELGKLFTKGMQDNMPREDFARSSPARSRWPRCSPPRSAWCRARGFSVDYVPGVGTTVLVNGKPFGRSDQGARVLQRAAAHLARPVAGRCPAQGRAAGHAAERVGPAGNSPGSASARQQRRQLVDAVDDRVGSRRRHRLAVVVAVADQHHRAAGGARGSGVVARVADHQRARRRRAQRLAGFQQRQRVGLLAREGVAAEGLVKKSARPLAASSGRANAVGLLVRQASRRPRSRSTCRPSTTPG